MHQMRGQKQFLIFFLIFIDQLTKFWVVKANFFWLPNYGISFGFFLGSVGIYLNFLILAVFGWFFSKKPSWGLSLILSGGISNLIDRLLSGYVIDFLKLPGLGFHFNLADVFITLGVLLILVKYINDEIRSRNNLSR